MGAGRIVEQEIVRVDNLIESGEFFRHPKLLAAVENCRKNRSRLHVMGLVQDQGVHATEEHLYALLDLARRETFSSLFIHFFADGRDTPPQSALVYLERLEKKIQEFGVGRVASVMGRYYAMDRVKNWERTKRAYDALVSGTGFRARSAREAIELAYHRTNPDTHGQETDEFIQPTVIVDEKGHPVATVKPGDSVILFNFRQDRAIQLSMAFVEPDFLFFDRGPLLPITYLGMTCYYDEFRHYVIPPMNMQDLVGEVLSREGLWQLRTSEYQKYRHVTSFFNGKRIEPYPREDRIQVPSITVPEDTKPEMSAYEVTELTVEAITHGIQAVRKKAHGADGMTYHFDESLPNSRGADSYDVIVMNYANPDMVGHTGNLEAAVKAVEVVDRCIGSVVEATLRRGGVVLITADHGNVEQMIDPATGTVQTAHTTNPVDFILVGEELKTTRLRPSGILSDVGPTMLELLGLPIPKEMTAKSLIES
jgi:2,3-bisphosphoglycerate-independent phosphoglycerate mutase